MRVTCRFNLGKALPSKYLELGYTEESMFDVSIGKEYPVFAMALWKSVLLLLLSDEHELPNWYPVELFSVSAPRLPQGWFFAAYQEHPHAVEAAWGYERLVCDVSHWEALLERDPDALKVFFQERVARQQEEGGGV